MQDILAELLRKLEAGTNRRMKPGVKDALKSMGVLPQEWAHRDQVLPSAPPRPEPSYRMPGRLILDAVPIPEAPQDEKGNLRQRQQIIANLLRSGDIGAGGGFAS